MSSQCEDLKKRQPAIDNFIDAHREDRIAFLNSLWLSSKCPGKLEFKGSNEKKPTGKATAGSQNPVTSKTNPTKNNKTKTTKPKTQNVVKKKLRGSKSPAIESN
jgi:hypothetical protein